MRISDWSSDVCSSDLFEPAVENRDLPFEEIDEYGFAGREHGAQHSVRHRPERFFHNMQHGQAPLVVNDQGSGRRLSRRYSQKWGWHKPPVSLIVRVPSPSVIGGWRSEEHTSELQSLMRNTYADS